MLEWYLHQFIMISNWLMNLLGLYIFCSTSGLLIIELINISKKLVVILPFTQPHNMLCFKINDVLVYIFL